MSISTILRSTRYIHSIKHRLIFWFLLLSLLPLGIVGYFAYSTASRALQADVEEKMTRISSNNLDKIDRTLLERMRDVQVWSSLELSKLAVHIGSGYGGAADFVNYLIQYYRTYSLIMLVDREGICITVNTVNNTNDLLPTEMFLGQHFSQEDWFQDAIQQEDVAVTDWHKNPILARLAEQIETPDAFPYSVVFSSAIRDDDGTILGVWANFLNWGIIQEIVGQRSDEISASDDSVMSLLLLNDNDTIIASSEAQGSASAVKALYERSLARDLQQPQLAEQIAARQGVVSYSWNGTLKTIVASREKGYEDYEGHQWNYLMIFDNSSAYAAIIGLRAKIIAFGMVLFVGILILVYIIGDRFATPLMFLTEKAVAIANGDLTHMDPFRLDASSSSNHHDEIQMLISSFGQMASNLQHLLRQIKEASSQVNFASSRISTALQQLSQFSVQQSSAIVQTTSTVEEFVVTSREIAKSANTIAAFAESTEQEAHRGVDAAVDTLARIQAIKQANDQNMQHVMFLHERSQEINKIVEVITNIADNTELIAFNAALEAAGAGEKGKRFGVVASEIRRLANTVATSVQSIDLRTSEIQEGIHALVQAFNTETDRIENGVSNMQVTATSLDSILGKIEKTTASLMQISAATRQQQSSNEQIVTVLHDMSQDTLQFQDITQHTLEITTELARLAEELQQTVNVFQIEQDAVTS